jgi:hypothetical protein
MHATIRRYEGVDEGRLDEVAKKVDEKLIPRLSALPGFSGYFLTATGNGVMTSISLFETSAQADESTRVAAKVLQEENLQPIMPNPPKVTSGELMAHELAPRKKEFAGV